MKTTFNAGEPMVEFTGLYKEKGTSLVVLAFSRNAGVVVQPDERHRINEFSTQWASFDNARIWTPIHGKVEFEF